MKKKCNCNNEWAKGAFYYMLISDTATFCLHSIEILYFLFYFYFLLFTFHYGPWAIECAHHQFLLLKMTLTLDMFQLQIARLSSI